MSLDTILVRQAGVVSREQALAAGLSPDAVDHRLRLRRWRPLHPRVYLAAGHRLDDEARIRAALLWAGDDAVLSGVAAAWWFGMAEEAPATIGLTVGRDRRPRPRPGVSVRRRDLPAEDLVRWRGLRLTDRRVDGARSGGRARRTREPAAGPRPAARCVVPVGVPGLLPQPRRPRFGRCQEHPGRRGGPLRVRGGTTAGPDAARFGRRGMVLRPARRWVRDRRRAFLRPSWRSRSTGGRGTWTPCGPNGTSSGRTCSCSRVGPCCATRGTTSSAVRARCWPRSHALWNVAPLLGDRHGHRNGERMIGSSGPGAGVINGSGPEAALETVRGPESVILMRTPAPAVPNR